MDVHKKTIAFCLDHAETGVVLDERELLHDLPKVINYLQKVQTRHGELSCGYEASSCGFRLQRTLQAKGISCEGIAPSSILEIGSKPIVEMPKSWPRCMRLGY